MSFENKDSRAAGGGPLPLILTLLLLGIPSFFSAAADERPALHFTHLTMADGLSQSSIQCMVQDETGFIWLGTEEGLNRYDGFRFRIFRAEHEEQGGLPSSDIASLALGEEVLWVGTSRGLCRYDPILETFTRVALPVETPQRINAVVPDRDGGLWIATARTGLWHREAETHRWRQFSTREGLSDNRVIASSLDGHGDLWVGCATGPLQQLPAGYEILVNHPLPDREDKGIKSLLTDRSGVLWVGTWANGLYRMNRDEGRLERVQGGETLAEATVSALLEDDRGMLWIGSFDHGLFLMSTAGGRVHHYRHHESHPHGLSQDRVYSLMQDRVGTIYLGTTTEGLNRFHWFQASFGYRHGHWDDADQPGHRPVLSILEDRDRNLWVGTWGSGLYRRDGRTGRYRRYVHDPERGDSLSYDEVRALYQDGEGTLWVGTSRGLDRFDPEQGTFRHFAAREDDPASTLSHRMVKRIWEDHRRRLWIATYRGVNLMDRARETFEIVPVEGRDKVSANYLTRDSRNRIWLCHGDGVARLREDDLVFEDTIALDRVRALVEDEHGGFWAAHMSGLARLDSDGRLVSRRNDDWAFTVQGMLRDDHGKLWLSTNTGLFRFDPDNLTHERFTVRDGLQADAFNSGAFHAGGSGRLFFGGNNGLNAFDPTEIVRPKRPTSVLFTDLSIYNTTIRPSAEDREAPLQQSISRTDRVRLSYRDDLVSFRFASPDLIDLRRGRFGYHMLGLDETWVEVDPATRMAIFTDLSPGEYTMEVRMAEGDGPWHISDRRLEITVSAPPWQSWWAIMLYIATGLGLIGLAFVLQRRELEQRREIAEQRRAVAEKDRQIAENKQRLMRHKIATINTLTSGVAHELMNPLNFVNNLSQISRELLGELRERVEKTVSQQARPAFHELIDTLDLNASSVDRHGQRARGIVSKMMALTLPLDDERRLVDLSEAARKSAEVVLDAHHHNHPDIEITLEVVPDSSLPRVSANPRVLNHAVMSLIRNAVEAILARAAREPTLSGRVVLACSREGASLVLTIEDNGEGMTDKVRGSAFDAFFTTRPPGSGHIGLGLTRTHDIIVNDHEGTLTLESNGSGCRVRLALPIDDEAP